MTEKTCMNCGNSGCDHKDARRCASGDSLWKPKVERDCNTCANHVQAVPLNQAPAICWACSASKTLPAWTPKKDTMDHPFDAAFRDPKKIVPAPPKEVSDGSTAGYYTLPKGSTELQDLISHKDMNAQMGEIFRACYRYGEVGHSPKKRDIKKIIFYANEELKRLEKLEGK